MGLCPVSNLPAYYSRALWACQGKFFAPAFFSLACPVFSLPAQYSPQSVGCQGKKSAYAFFPQALYLLGLRGMYRHSCPLGHSAFYAPLRPDWKTLIPLPVSPECRLNRPTIALWAKQGEWAKVGKAGNKKKRMPPKRHPWKVRNESYIRKPLDHPEQCQRFVQDCPYPLGCIRLSLSFPTIP